MSYAAPVEKAAIVPCWHWFQWHWLSGQRGGEAEIPSIPEGDIAHQTEKLPNKIADCDSLTL
jgi:hypothetical protein